MPDQRNPSDDNSVTPSRDPSHRRGGALIVPGVRTLVRIHRLLVAHRRLSIALGSIAIALGLVIYLWWQHDTFAKLLLSLGFGKVPLHDYYYFFYPMGHKVLSDPRPLDGFIYSPMAALFFVPFGAIPYTVSAWLWATVLLALTIGLAWESARPVRNHLYLTWFIVAATVCAMPVLHNHKFGQVSLLLVVPVLLSLRFYEHDRPISAAACLAFAASFKFYPILFLPYFLFKRDLKFLAAAIAFCLLFMAIIPAIAIGPHDTVSFYQNVVAQLDARFGHHIRDSNSQSFRSFTYRLAFTRWHLEKLFWNPIITWARYACWALFFLVTYVFARSRRRNAPRFAFMWLFLATPFFVVTSWPHYFVYLPAVAATIIGQPMVRTKLTSALRPMAWMFAFCSIAPSSIFFFDYIDARHVYSWWGFLFFANLSAMIALLLAYIGSRGNADSVSAMSRAEAQA